MIPLIFAILGFFAGFAFAILLAIAIQADMRQISSALDEMERQ
jgi:hypothetical protein